MKRILISLLFLPLVAFAGLSEEFSQGTYGLHLISKHDPDPGFNNGNIGVYVRTKSGWTAGTYINSFSRNTSYYGWTSPEWYRVSLSPVVVYGYVNQGVFAVIPSIRIFTYENVSLRGIFIPKMDEKGVDLYHLMVEAKF
jgi:hypothetical protein